MIELFDASKLNRGIMAAASASERSSPALAFLRLLNLIVFVQFSETVIDVAPGNDIESGLEFSAAPTNTVNSTLEAVEE